MQLRPRQREFVDKCLRALEKHGDTVGVAPTGAGKTVMLSAITKEVGGRSLVLQHRVELVTQNRRTFGRMAPEVRTDLYTADRKEWSDGTTFGMVQTLSIDKNLETMPKLDFIVIDEAHHVAAHSYKKIVDKAMELNPMVRLLGVTATPGRGDGKGMTDMFSNVADVIKLGELVAGGFLVKPRFYVIDCCIRDELNKVRVTANDFDMEQVAAIMDQSPVTQRVIEEWKSKAGDRRTVVFCSTVMHAQHVCYAFQVAGVQARWISGDMPMGDRISILQEFDKGLVQVIVNVAVLTEGWDCQPVSCVVLLRPCSYKSTMIQMIGRGLRKVDPELYPGIVKDDCVVLDFGYSLVKHGSIEAGANINGSCDQDEFQTCPSCNKLVPAKEEFCPFCNHQLIVIEDPKEEEEEDEDKKMPLKEETLMDFRLREVELLEASPYKWQDLFDGMATVANGMSAWAVIVYYNEKWVAVGKIDNPQTGKQPARLLAVAGKENRPAALASADDFLREHGDVEAAKKTKRWLTQPATEKQLQLLGYEQLSAFGLTKYLASCQLTWQFNEREIQRLVLKS